MHERVSVNALCFGGPPLAEMEAIWRELAPRRISFMTNQVFAEGESVGEASVFGGEKGRVALKAKGAVNLLVPRGSNERLAARIVYRGPLQAPVVEGAEVGRLLVTRGEVKTLDIPLYAAESVALGSLQQRALDALMEAATGWVRKALKRS